MRKITDYLGKPVLSVFESSTQGIVKDVLFDKNFKKLKFIVLFEDNDIQEDKFVAVSDIYSMGENAIVLKNNSVIESQSILTDEIANPINNSAYTTSGTFLGVVKNADIDDKFNLMGITLNGGQTIDISNILTSGNDTLFVQDQNSFVKLANIKKKTISMPSQNIKVSILTEQSQSLAEAPIVPTTSEQDTENSAVLPANQPENIAPEDLAQLPVEPIKPKRTVLLQSSCLPTQSTTKNNFLIGRKVQKNIYSFNHELIIKKNTKINEKIILLAKSHSKFKELSLNSI